MELTVCGKAGLPAVLLLPPAGMSGEELCRRLPGLEDRYRLICPAGSLSAEALKTALAHAGAERLWGAYGLREGATLLLELLALGVSARTAVVEGPFSLPSRSLRDFQGTLVCWKGGKNKKAQKSWEALKKDVPSLRSLTLGKLKKKQDYLSLRPDLMVKRLAATFGAARTVQLTETLPRTPETVWRELCRRPAGSAVSRLAEMRPLCRDDETRTQLLEGRGGKLALWRHAVALTPLGDDRTVCTDQVELDAGKLTPAAAILAKLYLRTEQKRRRKALRRET
ncbi:MAG: hypothetical protein IJH47_07375 [Oscillospiraceae bacterium]|nr:hypothetical protein [Oscillospiraceae bacterium]